MLSAPHLRSIAADWIALQRGLVRQLRDRGASREERRLARELRRLREATLAAQGPARACASCAAGQPLPHGRWDGGWCCGVGTANLFTPEELAALALAGTRPWHLRPTRWNAGCLFRGPRGCTLPPRHRPNVCVGYICWPLQQDLGARGLFERVSAPAEALMATLEQFVALRRERLDDQWVDSLFEEPVR